MKNLTILFALLTLNSVTNAQKGVSDFQKIDNGVYLLWYDQYSNKSVVGEFKDFTVLIEFPQSDSLTYEVIDFLKEKFPKKPLKYILHSHHHLHSISSFDPFLEKTKARLITTDYNFDHIMMMTKDTLELKNRYIRYDSVYQIQDKFNSLVLQAISQNQYLVPTKEYNIFYFTSQQILVQGCLFNKPSTYFEVINQRKTALRDIINDKGIKIKTLIPTNTSKANEFIDVVPIEMFMESFSKGIDPDEFCNDWQGVPVEALFARSDSIMTVIKKIPRSYDYLVLSNYLIGLHEDYLRAIALLKPLIKIYPSEAEPYERIGYSYEKLGFKLEAIAYYEKFLSLSTDEDDIKEIKKVIEELSK